MIITLLLLMCILRVSRPSDGGVFERGRYLDSMNEMMLSLNKKPQRLRPHACICLRGSSSFQLRGLTASEEDPVDKQASEQANKQTNKQTMKRTIL